MREQGKFRITEKHILQSGYPDVIRGKTNRIEWNRVTGKLVFNKSQ